jgi:hypothetical protein
MHEVRRRQTLRIAALEAPRAALGPASASMHGVWRRRSYGIASLGVGSAPFRGTGAAIRASCVAGREVSRRRTSRIASLGRPCASQGTSSAALGRWSVEMRTGRCRRGSRIAPRARTCGAPGFPRRALSPPSITRSASSRARGSRRAAPCSRGASARNARGPGRAPRASRRRCGEARGAKGPFQGELACETGRGLCRSTGTAGRRGRTGESTLARRGGVSVRFRAVGEGGGRMGWQARSWTSCRPSRISRGWTAVWPWPSMTSERRASTLLRGGSASGDQPDAAR